MLYVFYIFILISSVILIIPNARFWQKILVYIIGYITIGLCSLQMVSERLTGEGFNHAVLYHMQYGLEGAGVKAFYLLIFSSTLLLFITIGLWTWFIWSKYSDSLPIFISNRMIKSGTLIVLPICIIFHPTFKAILQVSNPPSTQLPIVDFFQELKPEKYKKLPPNIVWIYAESLERSYLNERIFPNLMPNLKQLEKESLSFTDIAQMPGTGWTIAGIVASQCGIPLVTTGGGGNSMSHTPFFLPGAVCLGDYLKENSFHLTFMGGADMDFAGKGKFLKSHGFDQILGKSKLEKKLSDINYQSGWGIYDDTLLELALEKQKELYNEKEPYALFLLTLDTHHPDGHIPSSCKNIHYLDGNNQMLNAIHCSDKLISEFIRKITKQDPNALIVLTSDHLAMPNSVYKNLEPLERRDLLLYHWPNHIKPKISSRKGTTFSSGVTALDLMGFPVKGFGLGRTLIGNKPTFRESYSQPEEVVLGWQKEFRKLWELPEKPKTIRIDTKRNYVSVSGYMYKMPLVLDILEKENSPYIIFDDPDTPLTDVVSNSSSETRSIWLDSCERIHSKYADEVIEKADHDEPEKTGEENNHTCIWDNKKHRILHLTDTIDYSLTL